MFPRISIILSQSALFCLFFHRLPFVKNIFYDSTYRGRDISKYKHVQLLDTLTEIGKSISDEELQMAKNNVKPHFTLHHLFTSVL